MLWKPIETMPRGEIILLRLARGQIILGGIISGRLVATNYAFFNYLPPETIITHWCELPTLPEEE